TGKRTVVLEFDLRKPKLLKGLGLVAEKGITNFVVDHEVTVDDLLIPVKEVSDLFVIAAGPAPPNPTELMLSDRVTRLIQELRQRFDYVLIDTAPIGQVSDTFSLNELGD